MAIHTIEPERQTLHGHFSRDLPPALTIDSGDTVRFRTLDASWGIEPPAPGEMWPAQDFSPRTKGKDDGHALCGPVEIRDALPGMTLEIQINEITLGTWGWGGAFVGQKEALALASLVVDLRMTQIVNGCCGVHAFLPDGALLDNA